MRGKLGAILFLALAAPAFAAPSVANLYIGKWIDDSHPTAGSSVLEIDKGLAGFVMRWDKTSITQDDFGNNIVSTSSVSFAAYIADNVLLIAIPSAPGVPVPAVITKDGRLLFGGEYFTRPRGSDSNGAKNNDLQRG